MTIAFGCNACYGADPQDAWRHHGHGVTRDVELVDDSHFIVSIGHCNLCLQPYVSIFTEFVDWQGGEDAQYRTVVPVTPEEAAALREEGENLDLAALGALGDDRRYLTVDWPTGAREKLIRWSSGRFHVTPGH